MILFHAGVFSIGWAGVDLFFGISGLLITRILLDAKAADTSLGAYPRPFYARRAVRILPIAWLVVVIVAATTRQWAGAAWYASFAVNWMPNPPAPRALGHYWTLAVEEQFYLVWPLVVYLATPRLLGLCCAAVPVLDLATRALFVRWHPAFAPAHFLGNATFARADTLAVGAWLALILATPNAHAWLRSQAAMRWVIAIGVFEA